eukprot:3501753-Amphidinium_carterae.1
MFLLCVIAGTVGGGPGIPKTRASIEARRFSHRDGLEHHCNGSRAILHMHHFFMATLPPPSC